ncbi:MAG: right-handed parallel beta-helix repeat-containing protein [Lacunisphaera sp.]|nr:right-handed parallel beta-helix repeat-containing protein [Lacunisphaera sp.]
MIPLAKHALLGAALAAGALAGAQEIWLAPNGNDAAGTGARSAPWRTVERARDHLRASGLAAPLAGDIVINLLPGTYPVAQPIAFGVQDSGRNGHAIVYRSADGPGRAELTGNVRITGWTRESGNVWKAPLPGGRLIRTLYENGRRAWPARTPNHVPSDRYPGYKGPYLLSENGGERSLVYQAGDLDPAAWQPAPQAELRWWGHQGKYNWGTFVCPIESIDPATRTIVFPKQDSRAAAGERYYVEGYRELLDAPGEFHADAAAGVLYYWPRDGDAPGQRIEAPQIGALLCIEGAGVGEVVHDLKFEGLALSGTDYTGQSVKLVGEPRAAAFLRHASRIEFRDCHFYNLGNLAIRMIDDGVNNTVTGCWIERTGEGGIQIYNSLLRAAHPEGRSSGHRVTNNRIHDFHEVRTSTHWCAVQLFAVSESEVSHCEIYNSGRYAISLRGHYSTEEKTNPDNGLHFARGNRFHHLRAWRCGGDSGDMGVLHAAHLNPTGQDNINYWNQIVVSDIRADPSMNDLAPDGIFLDHPQSCQNQDLRNIRIVGVAGKPFRTNRNPVQTLVNVSWEPGFDDRAMEYEQIGLASDFPSQYRGEKPPALPAVSSVAGAAATPPGGP